MRKLMMILLLLYSISLLSQSTQTVTFNYTGAAQYYTVPSCATTLTITVAGGQGGGTVGGNGAIVSGVLNVTAGQVLQINVGGQGNCPAGGWNGGGNGGAQNTTSGQYLGCGGGGASDIRISPYGLVDRVVVAAGGGGSQGGDFNTVSSSFAGVGGCPNGIGGGSPFGQGGGGGTTTAGGAGGAPWCSPCGQAGFPGALGQGGNGGDDIQNIYAAGGGGGGGYYGGGGGGADGCCIGGNGGGGGGGGSSLVPAGMNCTTGSITGNAGNGQIVIIAPICACTVAASNSGDVCTGGSFSLSASTFSSIISYAWSGPNGFTSNQQNTSITNAGVNASGVYTVVLTAPTGTCSSTTTVSVVDPGTITIFPADTICQESNFTLTASNNSTLTTNYSWTGPNGFASNQQNPSLTNVTPNQAGVYSVTTTVVSGTLQCSTSTTSTLGIVPIYTPNVTPNQTVCVGDNAIISATATSASSYSWAGPGGFTSNTQSNTFTNAQSHQSGDYTVTAIFTLGNTACSTYTVTNLAVLPKVNFTLSAVPPICPGDPIIINGPTGASSYTWTNPYSQVVSNQATLNIPNANSGMSGIYTVSVQPNGGCISSSSVNVTVLTPISFSITPNDITLCKGDSASVFALCMGGSGVYTYQWFPYTGLYFPAGFANIVKPSQSTYYTIIANDVACPQQTITANFWVNVLPIPEPFFAYNQIEGCKPLCVDISANSQPASINTIWDFGYNLYANGDSVHYCFDRPGVYPVSVFLIDSNGCKNTVQAPFVINVYPRPEPAIYFSPGAPTLLHNEVEFSASFNNGPITYWHWDFGDIMTNGDTANAQNSIYTYTYVSNYPVMLIATNVYGCTDTVYRLISVTEEFTMYIPDAFTPNGDGLNDVFQVRGAGFIEDGFEMMIYDRWGELIFKTNNVYEGWDGKVKGTNAKNDVYVYKIRCFTTVQHIKQEFVGHVTLYR